MAMAGTAATPTATTGSSLNTFLSGLLVTDRLPPFAQYKGQESYFGQQPPLSQGVGYLIVLGFGALFSIVTTILFYLNQRFSSTTSNQLKQVTSEHFNTAGRLIKTGLTASVIISQWTWAATLLQSSNVAWLYGVSGPFWYAAGATIQVLLFGVLAVRLKTIAPSAHTVAEIVNARWGRPAHVTFLIFCFVTNIIVTAMLLLGGAVVVDALTGVDYRLASFLIPWGVTIYTAAGGLQAAFLANYFHTSAMYGVLIVMMYVVYVKVYSSDEIYLFLQQTVSYTTQQCADIYSNPEGGTFYKPGTYACGPVSGNRDGSYLTMLSSKGFMFGIINIIGNFGTVFVDQSYWQVAVAARPESAAKGYLLGGLCWFAIPFSLATSLGLAAAAFMLPITATEAEQGLVPPAVATHLMGPAGSALILIMVFMAIGSTGASEAIAVASLATYDIYREYINPDATGIQVLFLSRVIIIIFGLFMGALSIVLFEMGLSLGWVYLFMGVLVGSAVAPLWNLMTWKKASGTGAVIAAWGGLALAVTGWVLAAKFQSNEISIAALGTNEVMLTGNVIAIVSSALIHWAYSTFVDPQDFDFSQLNDRIRLVEEDDMRGLSPAEQDPELLSRTELWITRRGFLLSVVLIVLWPLLSIPAGVFSQAYFAFWVLVSLVWGFSAAIVATILPWTESSDEINQVLGGSWKHLFNQKQIRRERHAEVVARNAQTRIQLETDKWSFEGTDSAHMIPESAPEP